MVRSVALPPDSSVLQPASSGLLPSDAARLPQFTAAPTWERKQLALQSPAAYRNYSRLRESCEWSAPVPLSEFIQSQTASRGYPWGADINKYRGGMTYDDECGRRSWNYPTRVCRQRWRDESTGDDVEQTITRIGPFTAPKPPPGGDGWSCFTFVPAPPLGAEKRDAFIVESLDAYYNASDGSDLGYPPIHPHHSNMIPANYNLNATWLGGAGATFRGFQGFPAQTAEMFAAGNYTVSSENSPGFNVDHLNCPDSSGTSSCFYLSASSAFGPRTGWPRPAGTDLWSNTIINTLDDVNGKDVELYMEYARKWVLPQRPEEWTPIDSIDFSVTGSGALYHPSRRHARAHAQTGLVWHTYTMPAAGRFLASYFHTHPQMASDMFVLDTDAEAVVPKLLLDFCEAIHGCGAPFETSTSYGVLPDHADIPLEPLNMTAYEVQRQILASPMARHIRCAYRSQSRPLNGINYGQSPLRAANGRCDGWRFEAGQKISLIGFNWPTDMPDMAVQHQRWFATAAFDGAYDVRSLRRQPKSGGLGSGGGQMPGLRVSAAEVGI